MQTDLCAILEKSVLNYCSIRGSKEEEASHVIIEILFKAKRKNNED